MIPPDHDIMCCFIVSTIPPVSPCSVYSIIMILEAFWAKVRRGSGEREKRAFWELFHVPFFELLFFFLILIVWVQKLPPQLELVCGALLSHSHLMENICCRAF